MLNRPLLLVDIDGVLNPHVSPNVAMPSHYAAHQVSGQLDSFWSAWEAFAAGSSYRDTIERAVRYGNDTDTTAAIAGGLAGLRWGLDEPESGVPARWLDALRGKHIVEGLLRRMLAN